MGDVVFVKNQLNMENNGILLRYQITIQRGKPGNIMIVKIQRIFINMKFALNNKGVENENSD